MGRIKNQYGWAIFDGDRLVLANAHKGVMEAYFRTELNRNPNFKIEEIIFKKKKICN